MKISEQKSKAPEINDKTLQAFVGYHLKRAFNVVQADLIETLKPFELRMLTYTALVLIVENSGLSQSQLADAMDVERPNLVIIVDELEQRELISRERVVTDRRTYALKATLKGRRLFDKTVEAVTAHERLLLSSIDQETQEIIIQAMHLIQSKGVRGKA